MFFEKLGRKCCVVLIFNPGKSTLAAHQSPESNGPPKNIQEWPPHLINPNSKQNPSKTEKKIEMITFRGGG